MRDNLIHASALALTLGLFALLLATGCATGLQVGNFHYGGSFLCGSYERDDGHHMEIDGCLEEAIHGTDE